jgi:hypothetical protein
MNTFRIVDRDNYEKAGEIRTEADFAEVQDAADAVRADLDFPKIRNLVNYLVKRDLETHQTNTTQVVL